LFLAPERERPANLMSPRPPGILGNGMRRRLKMKRRRAERTWSGKVRRVMSGRGRWRARTEGKVRRG
jgi:hypothetical protein